MAANPKPSKLAAALNYLQQIANVRGEATPDDYQQSLGLQGDATPSISKAADVIVRTGRGATRFPERMLGAPVDLVELGMGALGFPKENSIGGSNWMIDKMASAGLAYPRNENLAESVGDVAASFVNPAKLAIQIGPTIEKGINYGKSLPRLLESFGRTRGNSGVAEASSTASRAAGYEPTVSNLPEQFTVNDAPYFAGPIKKVKNVAEKYVASTSRDYKPVKTFKKVNWERATRVARAYDEMEHAPNDPEVKAAYDAMIDETLAQWEKIKKTGLKIEFIKNPENDPYAKSPRLVHMDVRDNNHLWVFPTESGFGGSESAHVDISGNPLLRKTGEVIDGVEVTANDIFRIVHDYFGHTKEGHGFRWDGEENAWRSHLPMYSPLAQRAVTSETRGQNSWVNFGPYGEANRTANAADTQYAPQKTGLMPKWVTEEGLADDFYPETQYKIPPTKIAAGLTSYDAAKKRERN